MSDILIKGMEMPKTCSDCEWSYYVGNGRAMCKRVSKTDKTDIMTKRRADFCPLIELPPHGRLGDLDKLEEQFKRAIETYIPKDPTRHMDVVTSNRCHAWCNGLTVIQDAPTVIEAEGSETRWK